MIKNYYKNKTIIYFIFNINIVKMFPVEIFAAIAAANIVKITTGQDVKVKISDTGKPILSNQSTPQSKTTK